jgi:hypothetical protein
MLLSDIRSVVRSRTRGDLWRTIKAPPGQLRCPPIRKQRFGNSGFSDVADPRYQRPPRHHGIWENCRVLAKGSEPSLDLGPHASIVLGIGVRPAPPKQLGLACTTIAVTSSRIVDSSPGTRYRRAVTSLAEELKRSTPRACGWIAITLSDSFVAASASATVGRSSSRSAIAARSLQPVLLWRSS